MTTVIQPELQNKNEKQTIITHTLDANQCKSSTFNLKADNIEEKELEEFEPEISQTSSFIQTLSIDTKTDEMITNNLMSRMNPPKTPESDCDDNKDYEDDDAHNDIAPAVYTQYLSDYNSLNEILDQFTKIDEIFNNHMKESTHFTEKIIANVENTHDELIGFISHKKDILLNNLDELENKNKDTVCEMKNEVDSLRNEMQEFKKNIDFLNDKQEDDAIKRMTVEAISLYNENKHRFTVKRISDKLMASKLLKSTFFLDTNHFKQSIEDEFKLKSNTTKTTRNTIKQKHTQQQPPKRQSSPQQPQYTHNNNNNDINNDESGRYADEYAYEYNDNYYNKEQSQYDDTRSYYDKSTKYYGEYDDGERYRRRRDTSSRRRGRREAKGRRGSNRSRGRRGSKYTSYTNERNYEHQYNTYRRSNKHTHRSYNKNTYNNNYDDASLREYQDVDDYREDTQLQAQQMTLEECYAYFNDYIPSASWRAGGQQGPRRRRSMYTDSNDDSNDNNGSIGSKDMVIYENDNNAGIEDGGFSQLSTRKKKKWAVKSPTKKKTQENNYNNNNNIAAAAIRTNNEGNNDGDDDGFRGNTHHIFVRDTENLDFASMKHKYRDIVLICQFSAKYHSKNGLELSKNRTVLQRVENQKHGYAVLDCKPVFDGQHCWRIKCKSFSPWIFVGVCKPYIEYTDTSWNNKYIWGISTCSQSNRNGHWSLDYSVKAPFWKNQNVLQIDMMLDCDRGTLKYTRIQDDSEINENNNQQKEINSNHTIVLEGLNRSKSSSSSSSYSWIPHFNLHTTGSTVTVKKIPHSRFGQIW